VAAIDHAKKLVSFVVWVSVYFFSFSFFFFFFFFSLCVECLYGILFAVCWWTRVTRNSSLLVSVREPLAYLLTGRCVRLVPLMTSLQELIFSGLGA